MAVYSDNGVGSFKKCGKFQINMDYGKDFDTLVLINFSRRNGGPARVV
jgi:hypothetical protein